MLIDGESTPVNLRLIGDVPGASRGRLEMSVDGAIFRPVCNYYNYFDRHEAVIFCQALGYDGRNVQVRRTQKNARRWALESISCSGAQSLDDCLGDTDTHTYDGSAIELDCGSGSTTGFDSCGDCGDAMLMGDDCSISGHTCDFRTGCEP